MERTVYRVMANGTCWGVHREDQGKRVLISRRTEKRDAIMRGRAMALGDRPSRLLVEGEDGNLEMEWNYGD